LSPALLSQLELINISKQLVYIGMQIERLSPTAPDTLHRVRELHSQINHVRQRFLALNHENAGPVHMASHEWPYRSRM